MESPYKRAPDSPSRQLLWELGRLSVTHQEDFQAKLDKETAEREAAHKIVLAAAATEHERIRQSAEREREKLEIQIQIERARRESEERAELERQRQEKVEKELAARRREIERVKAIEAEEKNTAELHRAEAAESQRREVERREAEVRRKIAEQQEAARRAAEEEKKRVDDAAAAAAAVTKKAEVPTAAQPVVLQPKNPTADSIPLLRTSKRDAEHNRYLEIHRKLKEFRKYMTDQGKQNAALKTKMGEMRRTIRKCVGQLRVGQGANTAQRQELAQTLKAAASVAQPKVDVTMFLANSLSGISDTQGPALLVYELNIFAKALVSQFIKEAGVSTQSADPVGTMASQIFAMPDFRWNGLSLIDILIAKFHFVCPVLFGIYGKDNTNEGRLRSGWIKEGDTGALISEQRHFERMSGLGAGFASIALRNYEKSKMQNPYPIYHYWKSLATIINVPPKEITTTHFIVLKAMVENNVPRILDFFGNAGLLALRKGLVELPQQAGVNGPAAKAVALLPDVLRKEKKLFL